MNAFGDSLASSQNVVARPRTTVLVRGIIASAVLYALVFYILVLIHVLIGTVVFTELERGEEERSMVEHDAVRKNITLRLYNLSKNRTQLKESIIKRGNHTTDEYKEKVKEIYREFFDIVYEKVRKENFDPRFGKNRDTLPKWSYGGALLHSIGNICTIGHFGVYVKTTGGQLFSIAYALVGIPLVFCYLSCIGFCISSAITLFFRVFLPRLASLDVEISHSGRSLPATRDLDGSSKSSSSSGAGSLKRLSAHYGTLKTRDKIQSFLSDSSPIAEEQSRASTSHVHRGESTSTILSSVSTNVEMPFLDKQSEEPSNKSIWSYNKNQNETKMVTEQNVDPTVEARTEKTRTFNKDNGNRNQNVELTVEARTGLTRTFNKDIGNRNQNVDPTVDVGKEKTRTFNKDTGNRYQNVGPIDARTGLTRTFNKDIGNRNQNVEPTVKARTEKTRTFNKDIGNRNPNVEPTVEARTEETRTVNKDIGNRNQNVGPTVEARTEKTRTFNKDTGNRNQNARKFSKRRIVKRASKQRESGSFLKGMVSKYKNSKNGKGFDTPPNSSSDSVNMANLDWATGMNTESNRSHGFWNFLQVDSLPHQYSVHNIHKGTTSRKMRIGSTSVDEKKTKRVSISMDSEDMASVTRRKSRNMESNFFRHYVSVLESLLYNQKAARGVSGDSHSWQRNDPSSPDEFSHSIYQPSVSLTSESTVPSATGPCFEKTLREIKLRRHIEPKEPCYVHTPVGQLYASGETYARIIHAGLVLRKEEKDRNEAYICRLDDCPQCHPASAEELFKKESLGLYEYRLAEMLITVVLLLVYLLYAAFYFRMAQQERDANIDSGRSSSFLTHLFFCVSCVATVGNPKLDMPTFEDPIKYKGVELAIFLHIGFCLLAACVQPSHRPQYIIFGNTTRHNFGKVYEKTKKKSSSMGHGSSGSHPRSFVINTESSA